MPTELILTNGERITTRAELPELNQDLANMSKERLFVAVRLIDEEGVVLVNPIHVVSLRRRD
jgi:hypothetical protein